MTNPIAARMGAVPTQRGIGDDAILAMIDEMNASRADKGIRERYHPVFNEKGILTMDLHRLPASIKDNHTESVQYYGMTAKQAVARGYPVQPRWRAQPGEIDQLVRRVGLATQQRD